MKKILSLSISFLLFSFIDVFGQDIFLVWNGSVSSDWNTAANWTPNQVPDFTTYVNVEADGFPNQPSLTSDANVYAFLMRSGTLNLNGFTMYCSHPRGQAALAGGNLVNGRVNAGVILVANMNFYNKVILEMTEASDGGIWYGNIKVYNDSLIVICRGLLHMQAGAPDSIFSHLKIQITSNGILKMARDANLYVQNDLIIDNTGGATIEFGLSGIGNTIINGNLVALNWENNLPNVYLKNITSKGSASSGPYHFKAGEIRNCSFSGNISFIADSASNIDISESQFLGNDNFFQAGRFNILTSSSFGNTGQGTTIFRMANKTSNNWVIHEGYNKFYGNVVFDLYAAPLTGSGATLESSFDQDSCFKNLTFLLKNNSSVTTNFERNSYVAGDLLIDAQGTSHLIDFGSSSSNSTFTVGGNFITQNFAPGAVSLLLHRVHILGNGSLGVIPVYKASIAGSSFKVNVNLIADSSQPISIQNSIFEGIDNLFVAGRYDVLSGNQFGQTGIGTTTIRVANNTSNSWISYEGDNRFYSDIVFDLFASTLSGGATILESPFDQDSCFRNLTFLLKNNSSVITKFQANSYVAGNLSIDAHGTSHLIDFGSSSSVGTFTVAGNLITQNFAPGAVSLLLNRLHILGNGSTGIIPVYKASISGSSFKNNISLVADSSQPISIQNSIFEGIDNLFVAGRYDVLSGNQFGQMGIGTTTIRVANNTSNAWISLEGNNKFYGDTEFDLFATTLSGGASIFQQGATGVDSCFGNLNINQSGNAAVVLASNYSLKLAKNLLLSNNSSIATITQSNNNTAIHFFGTDTVDYSYNGSGNPPSILNIELNRRGGLRLLSPLVCSGSLTLSRGILVSSLSNLLEISAGAYTIGGKDSSYVDGPILKSGNTAFTFPLGKNNVYAPLSISAPALETDVFQAQYIDRLSHLDGYDTSQHDVSLHHISSREYWLLDRVAGTSAVKVTLSWKTIRSGGINMLADMRIARWDVDTWKDEGFGTVEGYVNQGSLESLNTVNEFGPFTLASATANNPLPITIMSFTATLQNNRTVYIQWKAAANINHAFFVVERSINGSSWIPMASVYDRPESFQFTFVDNQPVEGWNYYRIKQVDKNSAYHYSSIRAVKLVTETLITIWPNPVTDVLNFRSSISKGLLEVIDANGKVVLSQVINNSIMAIPVNELSSGYYWIIIRYDGKKIVERFVKH